MACVAVNSLIRTLELEFLQPHPRPILQQMELIPFNKDLIQSLHEKLGFLIQLFDESRMDGVEAIKDLETKLRDVAFGVEDEIELHVVDLEALRDLYENDLYLVDLFKEADEEMGEGDTEAKKAQHSHRLRDVLQQAIEDIDAIKEELEKVMMEYKHVIIAVQGRETTLDDDVIPKSDDQLVKTDGSSSHASHTEDIMVGKNNEFETIMKMLIQHPSKHREVVSIQGMGGIGKTTLARRVYENPSIVSHYDKRLWVVVSQHHNKRQMLLGLLGSKDNVNNSSDGDLALRLYQSLKGQRYLVVMDDVWSIESWNDVNSCFPDDINGSRILLTSRVAEVATCISSNNYFSHQMHLLDQSESWELFHEKACKSQGVEFETIGRPIVEKCKGLPLAIVVVAGLFSKLNTLDEWKNTANALISSTSTSTLDDEECWRILSLSYNHLPHNLKACFLYLGVFPEDYKIKAYNLGRLWAAEGFVKAFKNESPEAVAERYINELMDRNLILVSKRSSCGRKIKAFRVHDLLRAFCVRECQNQSLLHVADESDSNFPQKGVRWIRVSFEDFDISALHSLTKHCRSIFYFLEWTKDSINLEFFSLLRVLYVSLEFDYLLSPTVHNHLRYLRLIGAPDNPHDSLFSNAWNLQTYSVYGLFTLSLHLKFPQLQYIHCHGFFGAFPKSVHQNLQVISGLQASSHCDQESLIKVPYLKKVSIILDDFNDWTMDQINDCTKNLVCLQQLESLSLVFSPWFDGNMNPQIINDILLLKNIRKLRFDFMMSEWKAINVLSKLPRLEVLKIVDSNLGEKWELTENVKFCHLICLKIQSHELMHWEVGANNFPKLERLFLNRCSGLREIPNSFAEIPALSLIQLKRCLPSTVMSAKQIQAEQHDYGNENMIVIDKDTKKCGLLF